MKHLYACILDLENTTLKKLKKTPLGVVIRRYIVCDLNIITKATTCNSQRNFYSLKINLCVAYFFFNLSKFYSKNNICHCIIPIGHSVRTGSVFFSGDISACFYIKKYKCSSKAQKFASLKRDFINTDPEKFPGLKIPKFERTGDH